MTSTAVVSAVLLVLYTVVNGTPVSDIGLTTGSKLRADIKRELRGNIEGKPWEDNEGKLREIIKSELWENIESELREEIEKELNETRDLLLTEISKIFYPGYSPSHPASSCKEVLQLAPQSPSGLYWLRGTDNRPRHMYCDMERSCKGVAGGWMSGLYQHERH